MRQRSQLMASWVHWALASFECARLAQAHLLVSSRRLTRSAFKRWRIRCFVKAHHFSNETTQAAEEALAEAASVLKAHEQHDWPWSPQTQRSLSELVEEQKQASSNIGDGELPRARPTPPHTAPLGVYLARACSNCCAAISDPVLWEQVARACVAGARGIEACVCEVARRWRALSPPPPKDVASERLVRRMDVQLKKRALSALRREHGPEAWRNMSWGNRLSYLQQWQALHHGAARAD
jgi:hypothetical protein